MNWLCEPPNIDDLIHPTEKDAMLAIQKSNFYNYIAQYCGDIIANAISIPNAVLTGYPVTEDSAPRLFKCYKKALSRLGCKEQYPLYVDFGYELSGKIYGSDENGYSIVINSECGELLTDNELTAFLGGEIGHLLAGHPQNRAILDNLDKITKRIRFAGEMVRNNILGLFSTWLIASEYTADRAALIAAENIDDLISLRKKQMGLSNIKTESIFNQSQLEAPEHPGMYFVLMAKELPLIGGVSRLQELYSWIKTENFAKQYASLLYKLCLQSKELSIPSDESLLERHRKASEGDAEEMFLLGEQYMFGTAGLPQDAITGESFLRQAAFKGNAKAMYLEGCCLELGIAGHRKLLDKAHILYRAAASRGNSKAQLKVSSEAEKVVPSLVLFAAKEATSVSPLRYWLSLSKQPLDKTVLLNGLNNFWVPIDEPVFAFDLFITELGAVGLIITSGGIYGCLKPSDMPFYISWNKYKELPLVQMESDGKKFLYCGELPFYLCKETIRGTMADLLIRIKSKMEQA